MQPRPAYLLLEQPRPRRGLRASRRAFYRLYFYNYELAHRLGLPLPPLARLNHQSKNPTKQIALALQWYLLVTEELLDSIFEGDGQVELLRPRDLFDALTVGEALAEARRNLDQVLNTTNSVGSRIVNDFEQFFAELTACDDCPCQFKVYSSNSEIRQWVDTYQHMTCAQVNTLDPVDYASRLEGLDEAISGFLLNVQDEILAFPEQELVEVVGLLLFLLVPLGEFLSYVEYVTFEQEQRQASPVPRSLLTFYTVLNPVYLSSQADSAEKQALQQFVRQVGKEFGIYQVQRLFPRSVPLYNAIFDRLPPATWLKYPVLTAPDLFDLHASLQWQRNQIIFCELSQGQRGKLLGSVQQLRRGAVVQALQLVLRQGVEMLRSYRVSRKIQRFAVMALQSIWLDEWTNVQKHPEVQRVGLDVTADVQNDDGLFPCWTALTQAEGLLQQVSEAWHGRHELSPGYCVLDTSEESPKHRAFVQGWQNVLQQTYVDSELFHLLSRYFDRTTAERHRPTERQLHSALAPLPPTAEPHPPSRPYPLTYTQQTLHLWQEAAALIDEAQTKALQQDWTETAGFPDSEL